MNSPLHLWFFKGTDIVHLFRIKISLNLQNIFYPENDIQNLFLGHYVEICCLHFPFFILYRFQTTNYSLDHKTFKTESFKHEIWQIGSILGYSLIRFFEDSLQALLLIIIKQTVPNMGIKLTWNLLPAPLPLLDHWHCNKPQHPRTLYMNLWLVPEKIKYGYRSL